MELGNFEKSKTNLLKVSSASAEKSNFENDVVQTVIDDLYKMMIGGPSNEQKIEQLLQAMLNFMSEASDCKDMGEVFLQMLEVLRTLISRTDISDNFSSIQNVIFSIMKDKRMYNCDQLTTAKLLIAEIETINLMCEKSPNWLANELGIILGVALMYSSYGLNEHQTQTLPCLLPTPILQQESSTTTDTKENVKNKIKRKQKKKVIESANNLKAAAMNEFILPELNYSQTSESDYSDTESSRHSHLRKLQKNVRMAALSLLLYIVRLTEKKKLIGFWKDILNGPYSVIECLKLDYSPHCKITATAVLMVLFTNGKAFVAQAQHSSRTNTYTSWSDLLADLVCSVQRSIALVIVRSQFQSKNVVSALLKCLTVVVSCTPYNRLRSGVLRDLVCTIGPLLKHSDISIRIAVLKYLQEVISIDPQTQEQLDILKSNSLEGINVVNFPTNKSVDESWIVLYCFYLVQDERCAVPLRAEGWMTLGLIGKYHFNIMSSSYMLESLLFVLLRRDLSYPNITLQQGALKAFEYFTVSLSKIDPENNVRLWKLLLEHNLVSLMLYANECLVASVCDSVAKIPSEIFEQSTTEKDLGKILIRVLISCTSRSYHLARANAIHSLGVIITFPSVMQDSQTIYNISETIIKAIQDKHLSVRIKAAWAFANLSELLLNNRPKSAGSSLLNLLEVALKTENDKENVKICSMRAVGYLLQLLETTHLINPAVVELVNRIITVLTKNASTEANMKVRWNCCYSLGNMFKNLDILNSNIEWKEPTLLPLSALIVDCPNFKVRQSACSAISELSKREYYQPYFSDLWISLIEAIKNAQDLTDFSEYKHQRNLIEQLCFTFCHFMKMFVIEDLDDRLYDAVSLNLELMKKNVYDVGKNSPEFVCSAASALKERIGTQCSEDAKLVTCQSGAIQLFKEIFSHSWESSDVAELSINAEGATKKI